MGMVHIPDDLERLIERRVADGLAADPGEFLRDAITRLIEDERAELEELEAVIAAGDADIAAGRFVTIETAEDKDALRERLERRLQASRLAR